MALGKLRAQAVRALQVVSAAHARAVPRPPAAQPPPAALSLVPDRQQSAKATLRIVLPDTIEIQAGWSKDVPVAADRGGVEGPVFVQLEGLPQGVMSPPVIIPARVNRSVACVRAEIEARSVELPLRVTAMRLTTDRAADHINRSRQSLAGLRARASAAGRRPAGRGHWRILARWKLRPETRSF